jgi:small-conductance mechanosensitive channel
MFSIETDISKRFIVITVAGHVTVEEAKQSAEQVRAALKDVAPGFVALTDFRFLESMVTASAPHVAEVMDVLAEKKVSAVVRVMPDPHKDIGLNILSQFHYGADIRTMTFETLADAVQSLVGEDG